MLVQKGVKLLVREDRICREKCLKPHNRYLAMMCDFLVKVQRIGT